MPDWKDPQYLQTGTSRQQRAYAVLAELQIWATLRAFDPVLAGTIPLDVDVPGSDLDIICEVPLVARPVFNELLRKHYGHQPGFQLAQTVVGGHESVVCNFRYAGEALEVFGQDLPTVSQNAYRHMVIEHAVLQAGGDAWRVVVRQLKAQGVKTEPAFAQLLGFSGNPYTALLEVESWSAEMLREWLARCPLPPGG